jgi:ribosomal protein S18 acetylase RimI-like enzyme
MSNRFLGHIDAVEPVFAGWVIDRRQADRPVRFNLIFDRALPLTIVADQPRPDVAAAGHGRADCGFTVPLPATLLDGCAHVFRLALADGQDLVLPGRQSPAVLGPVEPAVARLDVTDLDAVGALLRQTYREAGLDIEPITDKYVADWIRSFVGKPGGMLIGARVGEPFVGYAALERCPDATAIGAVALSIVSLYRRKGVGERLLRALLKAVGDTGEIDQVWLSVEPRNLPARRLYEKLGFIERAEPPSSLVVPASYIAMSWPFDRVAG